MCIYNYITIYLIKREQNKHVAETFFSVLQQVH